MHQDTPGAAAAAGNAAAGEDFVDRLCRTPNGGYLGLAEFLGEPTCDNPRIWFCKNTFTVLQVRKKADGAAEIHDFAPEDRNPDSIKLEGGCMHNLKCRRCGFDVQVKRIPGLSLLDLVPAPPWNTARDIDLMLRKLQAVAALCYLVLEFHRDVTLERVSLQTSQKPFCTKLLASLSMEREVLSCFLTRCGIFMEKTDQNGKFLVLENPKDAAKPRTRGLILKAAVELKMLIVIVVEHCDGQQSQGMGIFTEQQETEYYNFQIGIHEDLLKGTARAQYKQSPEESWESLKAAIIGSVPAPSGIPPPTTPTAPKEGLPAPLPGADKPEERGPASSPSGKLPALSGSQDAGHAPSAEQTQEESHRERLEDCICRLRKMQIAHPELQELKLPEIKLDSVAELIQFKLSQMRIWRRALDTYLMAQLSTGPGGLAEGLKKTGSAIVYPDKALMHFAPVGGEEMLQQELFRQDARFAQDLEDKASPALFEPDREGLEGNFLMPNPSGAAGLVNPGENLCGTNALLQLLFSVKPFVQAILEAPVEQVLEAGVLSERGEASSSQEGSLGAELMPIAVEFVAGLQRLFLEMMDEAGRICSAKEVAATLYGKELGTQQDADELWYRVSLYIEDGLDHVKGKPFKELQEVFRRLFKGSSAELKVRVRPEEEGLVKSDFDPEAAEKSTFLTIMVQADHKTISQTLSDSVAWNPREHNEVSWVQDRYRTFPPFLCFASKQVGQLDWEETLNLSEYADPISPEDAMERFRTFRDGLWRDEIQKILRPLPSMIESMSKVKKVDDSGDASQDLATLESLKRKLEDKLRSLPDVDSDRALNNGSLSDDFSTFLAHVIPGDELAKVRFDKLARKPTTGGTVHISTEEAAEVLLDSPKGAEIVNKMLDVKNPAPTPKASIDAVMEGLERYRQLRGDRGASYNIHGLIVYQGMGAYGHYIAFLRQEDGKFLGFDDERVQQFETVDAVRAEISERGSEMVPASVRLVVYKRIGASTEPVVCGPVEGASGSSGQGSKRKADGADDASASGASGPATTPAAASPAAAAATAAAAAAPSGEEERAAKQPRLSAPP